MFGTVEDPGELFQHNSVQTRVGSLSSTNQSGNAVVYKLVRVAVDGRLVPATDEEVLEVRGLLENDMPFVPDSRHPEGYIPVEDSPSQLLQLESLEGSPEEPALSTAVLKPEFSRVAGERFLDNRSIKSLQETYRAKFGHQTTCKDKPWLKRRIEMGLINSYVVPTTSLKITDNKPIDGAQDTCSDRIGAFSEDTVDETRATNCKEKPSSPENIVDHYSGDEDFEGEHRSPKRARKPTRRYIEENSETDEKQQSGDSMIPSKDESCRSIQAVSSRGRVVVTRMVSLAGSRIQVPYVSHIRRSRPREDITALGEFHPRSWEVKASPEESNLNVSPSQLKKAMNRASGVKSTSVPVQKESDKGHLKPVFAEVDQDIMEPERIDSSRANSDDDDDDLPMMQSAIRRKHHRAWTLSEVTKLVEGVSKYGVGKWSDIKRLSFSSNAYRTSVDIKDKWRNLQKASFAQTTSNKMGLRKHGTMAIPSQILLQVRELAQKQSLVSPVNKTRMVKKSRNRFL